MSATARVTEEPEFLSLAEQYAGDDLNVDPVELARMIARRRDYRQRRAGIPWKKCPSCSRELPARAFSANEARPDGLQSECKECRARRKRQGESSQAL